jgi:dTDP-4-dehydrorhamnose reductase
MQLIIGGDGILGTALRGCLDKAGVDAIVTTRRLVTPPWPRSMHLDLSKPIPDLPPADVVYIVAAVPQIIVCERDPKTWTINADAPVAIAKQYAWRGEFVVFVSSDAVQYAEGFAYARQKAHAEAFMNTINAAIIRPGRFTHETVDGLARLILDVGMYCRAGVHQWPWPN